MATLSPEPDTSPQIVGTSVADAVTDTAFRRDCAGPTTRLEKWGRHLSGSAVCARDVTPAAGRRCAVARTAPAAPVTDAIT
eukprot:CAMPEP_0177792956 /NCGR_PEP_ID=MMETSP0491_2-20121128/24811_1 /TAXON_ID=63592 /ORGANISM="Tetraselmis chuii, Strain PLY429" /LENGTH=80 /DNA_ID=CAMNT_0019315425 /DNA_START=10 /DNA_END=248 /DNA_ORIENTATION=+